MLLMATSPGGRGGATVLGAAKVSYPHAAANVVGTFSLPKFYDNFTEEGLADPELNTAFTAQVQALQDAL